MVRWVWGSKPAESLTGPYRGKLQRVTIGGTMNVHGRAAQRTVKRKRRKYSGRVKTTRVNPATMAEALRLAGGDFRRIERTGNLDTVIVRNHPWQVNHA